MQFIRKTLPLISVIIFLIFSAKSSFAQYRDPGVTMVEERQTIATDQFYKKVKMGQMMYNKILGSIIFYDNPYAFEITLKDSTQKKTYSNIYFDTVLRKCYLVVIDKKFQKSDTAHRKQKIYPNQTFKISRISFSDKVINGIANDSCWMFKVISGSINVYSYLSGENGPTFSTWTIIGIQQNDGPIIKYNLENLKQMVAQDSEALKKVENKEYYIAIKIYNRNSKKAEKK